MTVNMASRRPNSSTVFDVLLVKQLVQNLPLYSIFKQTICSIGDVSVLKKYSYTPLNVLAQPSCAELTEIQSRDMNPEHMYCIF